MWLQSWFHPHTSLNGVAPQVGLDRAQIELQCKSSLAPPPTHPTWLSNSASGICIATPLSAVSPQWLSWSHSWLKATLICPSPIQCPYQCRPVNHRNLSYYILSELIYLSSYTVDNNNPKIQMIFQDYHHLLAWYYNARENICTFLEAHYEWYSIFNETHQMFDVDLNSDIWPNSELCAVPENSQASCGLKVGLCSDSANCLVSSWFNHYHQLHPSLTSFVEIIIISEFSQSSCGLKMGLYSDSANHFWPKASAAPSIIHSNHHHVWYHLGLTI